MITAYNLQGALARLGEVLEDRQLSFHVAVAGGSALLLHQVIARPTEDVDVVALDEGPGSRHVQDLRDMGATAPEIEDAVSWLSENTNQAPGFVGDVSVVFGVDP